MVDHETEILLIIDDRDCSSISKDHGIRSQQAPNYQSWIEQENAADETTGFKADPEFIPFRTEKIIENILHGQQNRSTQIIVSNPHKLPLSKLYRSIFDFKVDLKTDPVEFQRRLEFSRKIKLIQLF